MPPAVSTTQVETNGIVIDTASKTAIITSNPPIPNQIRPIRYESLNCEYTLHS